MPELCWRTCANRGVQAHTRTLTARLRGTASITVSRMRRAVGSPQVDPIPRDLRPARTPEAGGELMVCGIVYVDAAVAVLPRRFCVRTVNGPASNECSCWPRRISHPLGLTPLPANDSDEGRHGGATRLLRRWRLDRAGAKVTTTQHRLHLASLRATDAAPLQPTIERCGSVPPCRHASSTRDVAGAATKMLRARSSGRGLIRDAAGCDLLRLAVPTGAGCHCSGACPVVQENVDPRCDSGRPAWPRCCSRTCAVRWSGTAVISATAPRHA